MGGTTHNPQHNKRQKQNPKRKFHNKFPKPPTTFAKQKLWESTRSVKDLAGISGKRKLFC